MKYNLNEEKTNIIVNHIVNSMLNEGFFGDLFKRKPKISPEEEERQRIEQEAIWTRQRKEREERISNLQYSIEETYTWRKSITNLKENRQLMETNEHSYVEVDNLISFINRNLLNYINQGTDIFQDHSDGDYYINFLTQTIQKSEELLTQDYQAYRLREDRDPKYDKDFRNCFKAIQYAKEILRKRKW